MTTRSDLTDGTRRRVLLTGAAGFVGSHLARLLLREGHEVTAIIRPESDRWRIADIERDLVVIEADLRALPESRPRLQATRPEICLHLAWRGWRTLRGGKSGCRSTRGPSRRFPGAPGVNRASLTPGVPIRPSAASPRPSRPRRA